MHFVGWLLSALAVTATARHITTPELYKYDQYKPKPDHNDSAGGNIIGGQVAEPGSTPWLASIQDNTYDHPVHFCGATILSHYWLLTAASCVYPYMPDELQVVVGEYDFDSCEGYEKVRSVLGIFIHPRYDYFIPLAYDVALLFIAPFYYNDWISPMPLPPPCFSALPAEANPSDVNLYPCTSDRHIDGMEGLLGLIAGWGETENGEKSHLVMEATLTILSNKECENAYPDHEMESLMCAANVTHDGIDACVGDSGGGLISSDGFLLGIYTYEQPCANEKYPGLYVNISKVQDWICEIISFSYESVLQKAGYNNETFPQKVTCN
ncbi:hypothetical protein SK128_018036 [Halocaridina rubra]|uniref:Peptidase S1 domain-containing protein n=1 Tax=Halocaridina rubra TaxID=373956 RepID=A0AAN8X5G0_HALRR